MLVLLSFVLQMSGLVSNVNPIHLFSEDSANFFALESVFEFESDIAL
jgi:hypothetical protein